MKSRVLWGILLLAFAIPPIYGRDCKSCHRHHEKYTRDYDEGSSPLKLYRDGYTYSEQSHPGDYRENIDRAKRGYDSPFGPFGRQDFEEYSDSNEYEAYSEPENDYIQGTVWTNINADADYDYDNNQDYESEEEYYEDDAECNPNYPYEEYARYSVSTDANKIPTYVDYFPGLRGFPYYIGHQSGPFFGNGYGGF